MVSVVAIERVTPASSSVEPGANSEDTARQNGSFHKLYQRFLMLGRFVADHAPDNDQRFINRRLASGIITALYARPVFDGDVEVRGSLLSLHVDTSGSELAYKPSRIGLHVGALLRLGEQEVNNRLNDLEVRTRIVLDGGAWVEPDPIPYETFFSEVRLADPEITVAVLRGGDIGPLA